MAEKSKKEVKTASKYKAVNPQQFKEWYTDSVPCYEELSKGESVTLNTKDRVVQDWLNNNLIIKE